MTDLEAVVALPPKAKRVLIATLQVPAGTRLCVHWYEYQRGSNFDKWPRERIQEAAEKAGFVEYSRGHPWVTPAGHEWATAQPL